MNTSTRTYEAEKKRSLSQVIRAHAHVMVESVARLKAAPLSTLMTSLVVGIALALPAILLVLLGSLQSVSQTWSSAAQISLFLHKEQSIAQAQVLRDQLSNKEEVAKVELISSDQALIELRDASGFGDVIEKLTENPLPHVLVVHIRDEWAQASGEASQSVVGRLSDEWRALPAVDQVVVDQAWLQRLHALVQLGHRVVLAFAVLLSMGVVIVVGNTIRLAIENRREEILLIKLVGGSDQFVRRPFLYAGMLFGLAGAILGYGLVTITILWLDSAVARLAQLYGSAWALHHLSLFNIVLLLLSGLLLGFCGARLAVARELHRIEPH